MVSSHVPAAPGGPAGGLLAGQIVAARYTCLGPLAQDLLGPVYRAQRMDGVPCTLQLLRVPLPEGPVVRRELERDLRTAASLRHPGLGGPVELVVDEGGGGYLVREAAPGQTLEAHLQRLGRPPVEAAFDILERVAAALRVAHRSGLLHLHLSPARVFLQQSPRGFLVRLLDVGLWRLVRPEQHAGGLVPPRYVAPEQVVSPRSADTRTDVYGLGLLLFELLCGRPPFASHDPDVLMAQHVNDAPPTLADRAPDRLFSAELENLVASALAKSPQDRPRDAGALLERLHQLRQQGDLVISLDEGEADLPPDWRIASPSDAEVLLAAAPPLQAEAELPVPVGPRAPGGARPGPLPQSEPVLADRSVPGAAGVDLDSLRGGIRDEVPGALAPSPAAAPPAADPGLNDLLSVEAMLPRADDLAVLQPAEEPRSAPADREEEGPWLRRPVRILGIRLPRVALLGGGLGCLVGLAGLLATLVEPTVRAPGQARPPGAQPGLSPGAAARGPAFPRAAGPSALNPLTPPAEVDRRPGSGGQSDPAAPPGRISLAAALGEPIRLPAPSRTTSARRPAGRQTAPAEQPLQRQAASPPQQDRRTEQGEDARRPERRAEDRQLAPGTEAERTRLRPGGSAVTVRILSAPLGAQVVRDGQVLGTTPFSEALRRASRPVVYEIARTGYEKARLEVVPSQDRVLQVDLNPIMSLK